MTLSTPTPKPTTPAPANAAEFKSGGVSAVRAPRILVRKLSDPSKTGLRIMLFGPAGSGKTFFVKDLLKNGWKVLFISTDIGGSGTSALEAPLRREGAGSALDNSVDVTVNGFEDLQSFIRKPADYLKPAGIDLHSWDPDIVYWDGFGAFQQIEISEFVGSMEAESKKGPSEQRGSGLKLEQSDWGLVRNATIRILDEFCAMHNPKTGKVWHKIVSVHESVKSKEIAPGKTSLAESKEPLLTGAGGILARGAFDLILKTQVRKAKPNEEGDGGGRVFEYVVSGHENLAAKNRGFDFGPDAVIPGDGYAVFQKMLQQRGFTKDQIDEKLKSGS
jgi:hypothetical protein